MRLRPFLSGGTRILRPSDSDRGSREADEGECVRESERALL